MKPIVEGHSISKKFCREYKRSIRYGFADIFRTIALRESPERLRQGEFWAVRDVSLNVGEGEALGIMGVNGSGKTTLLRIVSGFLKPDRGSVTVRGRVSPIFARGAGFDPVLTGYENIRLCLSMLGLDKQRIPSKVEPIIDFSELAPDALAAPIKTYSSGMLARLGFSCVVNSDPSLLIIDEALAVGDMKFRTKCYRRLGELKNEGTSFVMVSHSPNAMMQVCDRAIYLRKGRMAYEGDVEEALKRYESDEEHRIAMKMIHKAEEYESLSRDHSRFLIEDFSSADMDEGKFIGKTGRDLNMKILFLAKQRIGNLHLHLIIRSVREPDINFIHQVHEVGPATEGKGSVDVVLPKLSLRPGDYIIKMFFTSEDHLQFLDFKERTQLKVMKEEYFRGSHYQELSLHLHGHQ
ncbi:MAG: ABC transporter ATP-binding protein [Bdellovibrionaceae bacterium]|nr:ABC transporter ATP-binding protein [Pseudobdellovibrionaceae bacterium]